MKNSFFVAILWTIIFNAFFLAGCGGGGANGGRNSTATVATLKSIGITPETPGIVQGGTQQFTAIGTYSDDSTSDVTLNASWTSSNTSKATITNAGLATGTGAGTSTIEATYNGKSNSTLLTVTTSPVAPTITTQPSNRSVTAGQTATFNVAASGTAPLGYQWKKNGANIGTSASSYTTPATTIADNGAKFSVVVSNSVGNIASAEATLTVNASTVAPTIETQPANRSVTEGQTATFNVAASGTAPLSYQWKKNGANIGTNASSYTTPATTIADNGAKFSVVVSNSVGNIASAEATLTVTALPTGTVRIAYLHHSTGGNIWGGGVPQFFTDYNSKNGTHYQITSITYPASPAAGYDSSTGYPWANYPYDYWNLWVNHTGTNQDRGELTLDQIAASYDVIMFKHCFPVSAIGPDSGTASVSSQGKEVANYKLQYAALKARMKNDFPNKKFILWTGAALNMGSNNAGNAQRAQDFFNWVKNTWDEPGDNIFIWDFYALETEGTLYLKDAYASGATDSHPNSTFSATVAPYIAQRIVDVIEGRGDTGSITGH